MMKRQLFQRILLLCLVGLFGSGLYGCAVAAPAVAVYAVGTVYLTKERAKILVTEDESIIKNCEFVKTVASTTSWGGLLLKNKAQEKVIADLTEEAAQAGANTLLIRSKRKSFTGSYATGDAYRCPKIDEIPILVQEQPIE
jgi:hypothetical protein